MYKEVKNKVEQIKMRLLTATAESCTYKNWRMEYAITNIREAFSPEKAFTLVKIDIITEEELKTLSFRELLDIGFGNWENIALIPLFLKPFIDKSLEVVSINGKVITLGDADTDHRAGFLAYGIAF